MDAGPPRTEMSVRCLTASDAGAIIRVGEGDEGEFGVTRARRGGSLAAVILFGSLLVVTAPPAAAISDTCFFDAASGDLTGLGGTVGFQYRFVRESGSNKIQFVSSTGPIYCQDGATKASVANTDFIQFGGSNSDEALVIDLSNGSFAPGNTTESAGASEIEFDVDMFGSTDAISVVGGPGNDVIVYKGAGFIRLNDDGDNDVSFTSVDTRLAAGAGGDDRLAIDSRFDYRQPVFFLGGVGNDVLTGGGADDSLDGDRGRDTVRGLGGHDTLYGDAGNDTLKGGDQQDLIYPGLGNDDVDGGGDDDTIYAESVPDGSDALLGGAGDEDYLSYTDRLTPVTLDQDDKADDGAAGEKDRVAPDLEQLVGGSDDDKISGGAAANQLLGGPGNDTLRGFDGDDELYGEAGDDTALGGPGDDFVSGDDDNDRLLGFAGEDVITGGLGNDTSDGGLGDDVMYAESVTDGADAFTGYKGRDVVSYQGRTTAVAVDSDNVADDGEVGEGDNVMSDVEILVGGAGGDTIDGSPLADRILGMGGGDVLNGGDGPDYVSGDDGIDTVTGGDGVDELLGGNDTDTMHSNDGSSDSVACGAGVDSASDNDAFDTVQPDCEVS